MRMVTDTAELISTGGLAKRFGVSVEAVKKWDRAGRILPALRIDHSGRRVWRIEDLPTLDQQVAELRRANGRTSEQVAA